MTSNWCPREFLAAIPKADLHVHLDGSLRLSTLIELAQQQNVTLPAYDEETLKKLVFPPGFASLGDYLKCFAYTCAVMQDYVSVERISYEFAVDNYEEGVRYFEVRFAPQLHASISETDNFDIRRVIHAVNDGLKRGKDEYNQKLVAEGRTNEPGYDYSIIVTAMKSINPHMGRYYYGLFAVHPDEHHDRLAALASEALVQVALKCRDEDGIPVVALDVAGHEEGFQNSVHQEAFAKAHSHFLNKTVHAGESYGPESILQALRNLHAERIGHGFHLFSEHLICGSENVGDRAGYVRRLVKYICDRRICLEVCLTSNLHTMPGLTLDHHAIKKMLANGVVVCLNTDNRLVSSTTVTDELEKAVVHCGVTPGQLRQIVLAGFKKSFFYGDFIKRREYIARVAHYYDELSAKHGVASSPSNYPYY